MLAEDLRKCEASVRNAAYCPITVGLTQNQFDALVSFTYNCGAGCPKMLCRGRTAAKTGGKLPLYYNKNGGKAVAGLTRRR
jgi:GH24 family phage-related lysozyme (muramidase)